MNWLAHLLLAEPSPAARLGSILPDFVSVRVLAEMPAAFQPAIRQHRQVDAYTDSHAIFRRSVGRFEPPLRRFGGILVDVFYDHFLTREWAAFSEKPLPEFTGEFYACLESHEGDLPPEVYGWLQQMSAADLLCSYGEIAGLADALRRVGRRLRRPVDLAAAIPVLEANYDAFRGDFATFFPELARYVAANPPGSALVKSVSSAVCSSTGHAG
jgi:acyl carrier protein phosphodiesterase